LWRDLRHLLRGIVPGTPVRRINPSETPKPEPEPEPEPEPKTIVHRGIISVTMAGGGGVLGYVSATTLNGQYRYSDISSALIVTFETDLSGSGTQLNLVPEVGFDFPQWGLRFSPRLRLEFRLGLQFLGSCPGS